MSEFTPSLHTSFDTFDQTIVEALRLIAPRALLDIGAGGGKYGELVKAKGVAPMARLTALEIDPTCAEVLAAHYDEVRLEGADGLYSRPGDTYDTVLMGDVLEHLKASEGLDLLQFLINRSRYIIIATPEAIPMPIAANFYLGHNSIWRPEAFAWHDNWAHARVAMMHFYILRGYLDRAGVPISQICAKINEMNLTGSAGGGPDYPVRLTHRFTPAMDKFGDGKQATMYRPL